ncbi:hypothetical protein D3C85_990650 [compost metagenome]
MQRVEYDRAAIGPAITQTLNNHAEIRIDEIARIQDQQLVFKINVVNQKQGCAYGPHRVTDNLHDLRVGSHQTDDIIDVVARKVLSLDREQEASGSQILAFAHQALDEHLAVYLGQKERILIGAFAADVVIPSSQNNYVHSPAPSAFAIAPQMFSRLTSATPDTTRT